MKKFRLLGLRSTRVELEMARVTGEVVETSKLLEKTNLRVESEQEGHQCHQEQGR